MSAGRPARLLVVCQCFTAGTVPKMAPPTGDAGRSGSFGAPLGRAGRPRRGTPGPRLREPGAQVRPAAEGAPDAWCELFAPLQVAEDRLESVDDLFARRARLLEAELEVEELRWRAVGEHVVLRAPWLGMGRRLPQLLPGGAALAGDPLDQRRHFLGRVLPNNL